MDEEIEDIVGDVKYTDSQKSVAASNVYSLDFTDSGSEKQNSSGRETYVIEWEDSEDSDPLSINTNRSVVAVDTKLRPTQVSRLQQCDQGKKINRASATSLGKCSIYAQETFTQTSKTIIELAESETADRKAGNSHTLETQTSFISITENKTINYKIEISGGSTLFSRNEINNFDSEHTYNTIFNNSLEDGSSKFPTSETENEKLDDCTSEISSDDKIIRIIDADSKDNSSSEERYDNNYENASDFEESSTDLEEDSLMENRKHRAINNDNLNNTNDTPKSVDNDVAELYNKLSESIDLHTVHRFYEPDKKRYGTLTPLTEESGMKKDSLMDITPNNNNMTESSEEDKDVLFTNSSGIKVKVLPNDDTSCFKLPPIQNNYPCSNSPNLNFLFSLNSNKPLSKSSTLPTVLENQKERGADRWEIGAKELASGESPLISGRSGKSEPVRLIHDSFQLPPIHGEGHLNDIDKTESRISNTSKAESSLIFGSQCASISIKDKIKELKMSDKNNRQKRNYTFPITSESRSGSPCSGSPDDNRLCDAAERGCETLCLELLKRLRSQSWFEVSDTLSELPQALEKFWCVIPEYRIADLIRQVSAHVECPRTQVARTACTTLAAILKNTNYTKKPDFYEAMTILLIKTGSFSRPVRRAANVALDDIVCGVELSQAITAVCIHGASHKNPLVRCASARLLVVCCALGGGGRELLRARPPSAAAARRHALRSLAALLDDKNTDTRKYAERLYSMLRPQTNFEAYYLTDVEVDVASRQMKKYDQLLLCGPPNESR